MTGRPASRTRPVETEPRSSPSQRPAAPGPGHGQARPLLTRGAREPFDRVAVLRRAGGRGRGPSRAASASAWRTARMRVLGAVVADQDRPRLAQCVVRGHDHDRTRRLGGERSRDAAVEEVLESPARRRPAHQQRGAAVDRPLPDHRGRPSAQDAAGDVRVRERREHLLDVRARAAPPRSGPGSRRARCACAGRSVSPLRGNAGSSSWSTTYTSSSGARSAPASHAGGVGGEKRRLGRVERAEDRSVAHIRSLPVRARRQSRRRRSAPKGSARGAGPPVIIAPPMVARW